MTAPKEAESSYRILTDAAIKALRAGGWTISKASGHGRANVWNMEKNGKSGRVSIRTTRDRWIAYQPQNSGAKWKTLDDADHVCIAAFSYENSSTVPTGANIYLVDASVVKDAFDQSYKARISEEHTVTDNFGMWVCIDKCDGTQAAFVGSGFVTKKHLIADYPLDSLTVSSMNEALTASAKVPEAGKPEALSVSNILDNARADISKITGIPLEGISLDLHMKA